MINFRWFRMVTVLLLMSNGICLVIDIIQKNILSTIANGLVVFALINVLFEIKEKNE